MSENLWIMSVGGAFFGTALAIPLLIRRASGRIAGTHFLGLLLISTALMTALIGIRHGDVLAPSADRLLDHLVNLIGFAIWPAFLLWIGRAVDRPAVSPRFRWMLWAPAGIYVGYVVGSAGARVPFTWILPVAVAFSVVSLVVWISGRRSSTTSPGMIRLAGELVAFAFMLNAAQTLRTFWPEVIWLREVVPFTVLAGFLALGAAAMNRMVQARSEQSDTRADAAARGPRYAKSALQDDAALALLARLDRLMRDERWFQQSSLTLATIASRLNVSSQLLSEALNRVRRVSLSDYVAALRVDEARRRLADPANDQFTIDGIGADAGFASRSAFYKTFRRFAGTTPTEFRRSARTTDRDISRD